MELHTIIVGAVATVATLIGLFGWSHKSLRQRLDGMEVKLNHKLDPNEARVLVADKIAPIDVAYQSLSHRINDLQRENHKLNDKIDKLLVICTEMVHKDDRR